MAERSAVEWAEAVRDAERRGELLTAFDLAERALEEHSDDLWLRHRAVLALARAGSTDQAARRFREYGLTDVETEDVAALRARIVKDIALGGEGAERRQAATRSAELYAAIHARTGGWYPAVNAATLSLVAGDPDRAREFAQAALDALARHGDGSYYAAATEAEAELVLGRPEAARDAIARAVERNEDDYGALTTTRRQLRLVCQATGTDPAVLAPLAGPSAVHFCGRQDRGTGRAGAPPRRGGAAARRRRRCGARAGAGRIGLLQALARGADILLGREAARDAAELHIVLPLLRHFRGRGCARQIAPTGAPGRALQILDASDDDRVAYDDALRPRRRASPTTLAGWPSSLALLELAS